MAKSNNLKEVEKALVAAKNNLKKIMNETVRLAERGEKELVNLSKLGKLEFDILSLHLKKEVLSRQLGEKLIELNLDKDIDSEQIKTLSKEIRVIDSKTKQLKMDADKIDKNIFKD